MTRRDKDPNRPRRPRDYEKDLETDELEQPVFDEENVGEQVRGLRPREDDPEATDGKAPPGFAEDNIAFSGEHSYSLDAATKAEYPSLGEGSETVMDEIDRYTDDEDVLDDFSERQQLNTGREDLLDKMRRHHSKSPDLSGGDLDAAWQDADVSGEETVGSTVTTPDQDVVDELGDAFGLDYEDDEPLQTADKLEARDRNRIDLSPASMEQSIDMEDIEDEDELEELLEDDLGEDLDEGLDEEEEEELEEDLDDKYPEAVEAELELEGEEEDEDLDEDEADNVGYEIEDLEDEFDEELDELLDEEYDDDEDY